MGSRPWKNALFHRISPDHEGDWFVCERPNGEVIEGRYLGWCWTGQRHWLQINDAPEGTPINAAFFARSREVTVERGLKINGQPAEDFDGAELTTRTRGRVDEHGWVVIHRAA